MKAKNNTHTQYNVPSLKDLARFRVFDAIYDIRRTNKKTATQRKFERKEAYFNLTITTSAVSQVGTM